MTNEDPALCDRCGRVMDGNHNFWDGDTICLGPPTAHQYNEFHDMLAHYLGRIVTELERGSDPLSEALRR